jgi:spermidine/putrescine transport system permease protein
MIAHTVFCVPFAYLPIRARLENMDLTLEQAAADLYATPWRAFRFVTLPLLMPGIIAGAMLAFIVSLDDVIITLLVARPGQTTLPIFIYGMIRRGVTPEVNAISTILLVVSVLFVTLFFLIRRRDLKKG